MVDKTLGKLKYRDGWRKNIKIKFNGKHIVIPLFIKGKRNVDAIYEGHRRDYEYFKAKHKEIIAIGKHYTEIEKDEQNIILESVTLFEDIYRVDLQFKCEHGRYKGYNVKMYKYEVKGITDL